MIIKIIIIKGKRRQKTNRALKKRRKGKKLVEFRINWIHFIFNLVIFLLLPMIQSSSRT